ncbi:MAG: ribokinase [Rhodobacteraceae bacterium]|nr:ribokinase [Paracoccaceae bacterium]
MMFNFGSINMDLVYRVSHLPEAGETLHCRSFERFLGGKGINQSIAMAQSGAPVRHIGCVGADGAWVRDRIRQFGIALDDIVTVDQPTGHAIICVDDAGENRIVVAGGANHGFTRARIDATLATARAGDWVMLQNETNLVPHIAAQAKIMGLHVCYSAAPLDADAVAQILPQLDMIAINEGEAAALAAAHGRAASELGIPYVLITRGRAGAVFHARGTTFEQAGFPVTPVDTTGAGDTFLGAFMARFVETGPRNALRFAAASAAIQVTRPGAAAGIPARADVEAFLANAQDPDRY